MDVIYAEKYYKQIQERFPYLSEKQIDKIVKYGLRSFFVHNRFGADVLLKSNYYTAYVGKLYNKMDLFARYWAIKMRIKLRIKYRRAKTPFNGKYYIGLRKEDYDKYFPRKGRKLFVFNDVNIYKLYEECILYKPDYVLEIDYPEDLGFLKKLKTHTTRNVRLYAKKNKDGKVTPVDKEVTNETNSNKRMKRRN